MKIGIDKIAFYVPSYYIELNELAKARGIDPAKYTVGLGQNKTAIMEKTQDCITLAANAAKQILNEQLISEIDLVLFATESSIDESKAGSIFLQSILNLRRNCRYVELKQACYSSAVAINFAKNHIMVNPHSKVLVIASDIAKYGINSAGEPTQGAGAVAMIISQNPNILVLNNDATFISEDVNDFFRPTHHDVPIVDGKLSTETYIRFFQTTCQAYLNNQKLQFNDFAGICFHMPFTKLGQKALLTLTQEETLITRYEYSKYYSKEIGNIYTGSLFLSMISLLEQDQSLQPNDLIGFFAYGSGATGEFFTGRLVEGYQNHLMQPYHESLLQSRNKLTITEYENLYNDQIDPKRYNQNVIHIQSIENNVKYYTK